MYGGSGTFNIAVVNDRVVEGPEYLEIRVDRPGGWTHYRTRVYIKDANSRVDLTVDTDSDEDGNQDVLTGGGFRFGGVGVGGFLERDFVVAFFGDDGYFVGG